MFGFAWSEWMVIGVVALVAIGPKDMPAAIRTVARLVRRARSMAQEFQGHVDDMVRGTELGEIKRELGGLRELGLSEYAGRTLDRDGAMRRAVRDPFAADPVARTALDGPEAPPVSVDPRPRQAVPVASLPRFSVPRW